MTNFEDIEADRDRIRDNIFGTDDDPDVIQRLHQELAIATRDKDQTEKRLWRLQAALADLSARIDGSENGHLAIKVAKLLEHNARMRRFLEMHEWQHEVGCPVRNGDDDTCNCDEDCYEGERLDALEAREPKCTCKAGGVNFPQHDDTCTYSSVLAVSR